MTLHAASTGVRWLAMSGVASPLVLAAATIIASAQHPGYSHARQTLSELGAAGAPGAAWMNVAGIVPAGALVAISALPLRRAFGNRPPSTAGAAVLAAAGACFVAAGLLPLRRAAVSLLDTDIHSLFAAAGFVGLGVGPLLFALHARRHPPSAAWFAPSLTAAVAEMVLSAGMALGAPGAFQRAALTAFYTWLVAASVWAFRRGTR